MNVLVVDIGGSHVKVAVAGTRENAQFDSTPDMTAAEMLGRIIQATQTWKYDVVSIGYPGRVGPDGPTGEPGNLGPGWVGYDFVHALGKPVRIVNDAVLQALGAYDGGRMLFLGLGTGVGSALISEHVAIPLELGDLPYGHGQTLVGFLGRDGLERLGLPRWREMVLEIVPALRRAFLADYVVLGGGNVARVETVPDDTRCGGNEDAIEGGLRLWRDIVEPHDKQPSRYWRVVQ